MSVRQFIYDVLKLATLMGIGNMIVDDCSVDIPVRVCRYRNCRAFGDCWITSAATLRAPEAFCSPSAAMT